MNRLPAGKARIALDLAKPQVAQRRQTSKTSKLPKQACEQDERAVSSLLVPPYLHHLPTDLVATCSDKPYLAG
jgi:hypothetical protein